jgi:S1-C subfamily serine protease
VTDDPPAGAEPVTGNPSARLWLEDRPMDSGATWPPTTPEPGSEAGPASPSWPPPPAAGTDSTSTGRAWGAASWSAPGWTPPSGPPHRSLGMAVSAGVLAVATAAAIVLHGHTVLVQPGSSTAVSPSVPSGDGSSSGTGPFSGLFPRGSAGNLPGGAVPGGAAGSGGSVDTSAIAAQVDPGIVDVTSTLIDGVAAGTGMVLTSGGEVLTNNHVIDGATRVQVQVDGSGPLHPARVLAADPSDDVALLQIEGVSRLRTVSIGDSSSVAVGDTVVALGNALGRSGQPSAAAGQVTAIGQTITATDDTGASAETLNGLIQVNAGILPGDSGGPLVNTSGRVVGMDTAASSGGFRRRSVAGVGFAIPIDSAMAVVQQMRSGAYRPGTSSGGTAAAPAGQQALLGVEVESGSALSGSGALVVGVQAGTPAEGAGLTAGDAIVGLGGTSVTSAAGLTSAIRAHHPGDRVEVVWLDQAGQQQSATVRLASAA